MGRSGWRRRSSPTTAEAWSSPEGSKAVKRIGGGFVASGKGRVKGGPVQMANGRSAKSERTAGSESGRLEPSGGPAVQSSGDLEERFDAGQVGAPLDGTELRDAHARGVGEIAEGPGSLGAGKPDLAAQFEAEAVLGPAAQAQGLGGLSQDAAEF